MVLTEHRKGPAFNRWEHVPDSLVGLHVYIRSHVPLNQTNCSFSMVILSYPTKSLIGACDSILFLEGGLNSVS